MPHLNLSSPALGRRNTACTGQAFLWCTLPKCSHPGIYQAGRTLHLITVHGLFLLESAFLNSFTILASTSSLAMISTILLGEKLVRWYNIVLNLIVRLAHFWVGFTFSALFRILCVSTALSSATTLLSWRVTAYSWKLFCSSLSFLLSFVPVSYIFLNIRMTGIMLHIQNRKGPTIVYMFFLSPRKVHFKTR